MSECTGQYTIITLLAQYNNNVCLALPLYMQKKSVISILIKILSPVQVRASNCVGQSGTMLHNCDTYVH